MQLSTRMAQRSAAQHSAAQHSTAQHSTAQRRQQDNKAQHSTAHRVQCSTAEILLRPCCMVTRALQHVIKFCLRVQAYLAKSWFNLLLLGAIMQSPCVVHAI
jgi:hypothetical protein